MAGQGRTPAVEIGSPCIDISLPLIVVVFCQVICAAKLKSQEFEQALSQQHTAVVGDEKGRLALAMLALLGGGEDEAEAARAGEQLRGIWDEAHRV